MTHYQKIATLIFRIIGILGIAAGLVNWISTAAITFFLPQQPFVLIGYLSPLIYLTGGYNFLRRESRAGKMDLFGLR